MTDILKNLIQKAQMEASSPSCETLGHDWVEEGARSCPTGCRMCSQVVYRCRSCGIYDFGDHSDSPSVILCRSICDESMTGWRGGHMDVDEELF